MTGLLRDAHARVTRVREALADGDTDFALHVLDDLAADLWTQIETVEHTRSSSAHTTSPPHEEGAEAKGGTS